MYLMRIEFEKTLKVIKSMNDFKLICDIAITGNRFFLVKPKSFQSASFHLLEDPVMQKPLSRILILSLVLKGFRQ